MDDSRLGRKAVLSSFCNIFTLILIHQLRIMITMATTRVTLSVVGTFLLAVTQKSEPEFRWDGYTPIRSSRDFLSRFKREKLDGPVTVWYAWTSFPHVTPVMAKKNSTGQRKAWGPYITGLQWSTKSLYNKRRSTCTFSYCLQLLRQVEEEVTWNSSCLCEGPKIYTTSRFLIFFFQKSLIY